MSRGVTGSASGASRATLQGSSKVSNIAQEGLIETGLAAKGLYTMKDTAIAQVERKLKRLDAYKHLEGEELLKKVAELIDIDTILLKFSHLVEHRLVKGFEDVAEDKEDEVDRANVEEFREAKDRERLRHVQVAKIPLKISVCDLEIPEPVMPVICPIGNFLCTDYGTKHVGLTVGNVLLQWGMEGIVDPEILEDGQEAFPDAEVQDITKYCPHNIAVDRKAPLEDSQLQTAAEETEHLFEQTLEKKPIFEELAKVIAKYNSRYHYNVVSRNCQGFVRDALKALGIENKPTPTAPNQLLQDAQAKKSKNIPSSFAKHEDLDAYLMKQSRDWFKKLDADSLEFLQFSYLHFHGDISCYLPTCQAHILADVLQHRLN